MKFYDRNKELTLINKLIKTTREKGSRILVVTGKRRMNEIEQFSGIRDVGPYLKNLEDIYKLTERRLPVTSKSKKEKKGRYYIKDNFLGFWFRFIEPKRILKEMNRKEMAFQEIWDQLPDFEGRKLEDMVIRKMIEENPLQIDFHKAGKYWDRKGLIELDAVFINERENKVYVFEVKTNKDKINKRQLRILYDKAKAIPEFFNQEINLGISYLEEDGLQIELV